MIMKRRAAARLHDLRFATYDFRKSHIVNRKSPPNGSRKSPGDRFFSSKNKIVDYLQNISYFYRLKNKIGKMRHFYCASILLLSLPITVSTILTDGTPLAVVGLVTPWGTNGVYSATPGDTVVYTFQGTSSYHLMDVEIDSVSQGPIHSYTFYNVAGPHTIVVTYGECAPVTNLAVSQVAGTTALVTWNDGSPGATMNYTLQYRATTSTNWTSVYNLTGTSHLLSGLTPLTDYEVRVWSFCGGILEGDWVITQFHTTCLTGSDVPIGDGTNTIALPAYSLYSYNLSEQIFTASELGLPNTFHSISFQAANVIDTARTWDIYLMPTTRSSLTSFVNIDSTAQLVFSGTVNITAGWFTIPFDSSFVYDGFSNLMLIVDDNTGSWVNGSNTYYCKNNPNRTSVLIFSDNTNFDPYNVSNYNAYTYSYRNNVIFGGICDTNITCVAPNFIISDSTESTIGITWVPGSNETTWNLEYKPVHDTIWNHTYGLTGSNHTITGLNANTEYIIRLQANCGSDWRTLRGRTTCGEISLPFSEDFESGVIGSGQFSFILCWNRLASSPSSQVYRSTQHNHTPAGSGALDFNYTSNNYTMAIVPAIHNSYPMNSVMMEFEAKHTGAYGTFEVGIISDILNDSTFVVFDTRFVGCLVFEGVNVNLLD